MIWLKLVHHWVHGLTPNHCSIEQPVCTPSSGIACYHILAQSLRAEIRDFLPAWRAIVVQLFNLLWTIYTATDCQAPFYTQNTFSTSLSTLNFNQSLYSGCCWLLDNPVLVAKDNQTPVQAYSLTSYVQLNNCTNSKPKRSSPGLLFYCMWRNVQLYRLTTGHVQGPCTQSFN